MRGRSASRVAIATITPSRLGARQAGVGRTTTGASLTKIPAPQRPGSALERDGQLRALTPAKRDRHPQPLEMLIDNLSTEANPMGLKELVNFGFAFEQSDNRLTHPGQRC